MAGAVAVLILPAACTNMPSPALPDPDIDLGLGDVVLLTWTTRSPDGILGHAMIPDLIGVDPHRKVVSGKPRWVDTSQRMHFMFTRQRSANGKLEAGMASVEAGAAQVTHVAYEVHLTRYLELPPEALTYASASGCCMGGQVTEACGAWYVFRMMWGTGKVLYLQRVSVDAGVSASGLLHAQGGTAYRRLNELSFDQAFFAYEAVPLADLCAGVQPEQEMPTLSVIAPRNCWALAQRKDGSSTADAWHVPAESVCRNVVRHHCGRTDSLLSCHLTFGSGEDVHRAIIPPSELEQRLSTDPNSDEEPQPEEAW